MTEEASMGDEQQVSLHERAVGACEKLADSAAEETRRIAADRERSRAEREAERRRASEELRGRMWIGVVCAAIESGEDAAGAIREGDRVLDAYREREARGFTGEPGQ